MYIIICLDDNNGLAFNHRRQSQDRIVAEDIRKTVGEKKLWITDYSRKLFHSVSNLEISGKRKKENMFFRNWKHWIQVTNGLSSS